jgi:uncharacterized protein (DUF58 family)
MSRLLTLAIVLALIAVALRLEIVAVVAVALAAAIVLSRLWMRQIERSLRITRHAPAELPYGDEAQVTIEIRNQALVRVPWLAIRESVAYTLRTTPPAQSVVTLGAGETHRLTYRVRGARRGWYTVGPLLLTVGDVLGVQRRRLSAPATQITVFPRIVPLSELALPASLSYGPLVGRRTEDPARPAGVRMYQPGDDVRRLDWKSSARQQQLLVRRADATIAPETTIVVALGRHDYAAQIVQDALERAIVAAASLGAALLARKLPVSLVANGYDPLARSRGVTLGFGKGEAQRHALLRLLGRVSPGDGVDVWALLHRQPLPWGGTLALVLGDLTLDMLPQIVALRRRGQQVVLLLIEPTTRGLALAHQQHLPAYRVDLRGQVTLERGA